MSTPPDPVVLAAERETLARLASEPLVTRVRGYLRLLGPGYVQSAMTLGGGTASSALFAGAVFGYELLWVAPIAMLLGVIVLSAVSHQTLSTGMRPYQAMKHYAGAPWAWAWAIGALLSSIIWHFPQYSLASAVLTDMADVIGVTVQPTWMSFLALSWAIALSFLYGSGRMVRWYERILKVMVWSIVVSFGLVVVKTGISDWGALLRGFTFRVPADRNGIAAATVILSGLAAAVGVNMLFLYPYSLLARGWGRDHRRLARADLIGGMFLPYILATSLMIIATANTIYQDGSFVGKSIAPVEAARSLADVVGETFGRIIFNVGILAMALSSITLQMLTAGFVCTELFGWRVGSWRYRLATLLPTPGVLGPFFWGDIKVWLAVPTNILCGFFLPAAYIGFIRLQKNRRYLGDDMPKGSKGFAWISGMILTTLILIVFLGWYAITKGPTYFESFLQGR